jgi:hypothetical protein
VDTGGGAWCWGYNYSGMLGTGGGASHEANPVSVFGLNAGVAAVEAGWEYSCALTVNEGVKCWGSDSWGVLGHGITPAWSRPIPTAVWGMTGNATESYRPDVEVKRVGGFYIGNDTYTTDATGQTLTTRLVQGEHKEFLFRFSNDSNVDDTVFLGDWNTGGSLKYRWRFFLGTTEIGLRTGSYWTVLAPGESLTIRLRIYKRLSAPDIKLAGVWVGIYSSNDSARYDLARVQVVA